LERGVKIPLTSGRGDPRGRGLGVEVLGRWLAESLEALGLIKFAKPAPPRDAEEVLLSSPAGGAERSSSAGSSSRSGAATAPRIRT
jgi:hypothetical protein